MEKMMREKFLEYKVSIDLDANAMYYKFSDRKVAKSEEKKLGNIDAVLDYDSKGNVVGIEVLNFKEFLKFFALYSPIFPMGISEEVKAEA